MIIRPLTKDLIDDFITFFDTIGQEDEVPEHRCYCVCWGNADYQNYDFSTADKRRELAKEFIANGQIKGYLVYDNDIVIGWCNANTKKDLYKSMSWSMFMKEFPKDSAKTKSIYCFTIANAYKHQGIPSLIIKRVIEDAKIDGFEYVEAYPQVEFTNSMDDFMGVKKVFENCGFKEISRIGNNSIMSFKL